jgi:hypothetical protein
VQVGNAQFWPNNDAGLHRAPPRRQILTRHHAATSQVGVAWYLLFNQNLTFEGQNFDRNKVCESNLIIVDRFCNFVTVS